jgi:nicotinate-nucleotide pyrophosphorylase
MGAIMGGNVRVGLEDSLLIGKNQLATSNAAQVRKIRAILEELGHEIATPQEAREMLHLKGADKVKFSEKEPVSGSEKVSGLFSGSTRK